MNCLNSFYNFDTLILFLGGFFSLTLAVIILIAKQEYKRSFERDRLTILKRKYPEAVGDVEANINDSYEFRKLDFFELMTLWGLQPLFIIAFIDLFNKPSVIEIIIAFGLTLLIILHEFWLGNQYSKKFIYQLFIAILWISLFGVISHREVKGKQQNVEGVKK